MMLGGFCEWDKDSLRVAKEYKQFFWLSLCSYNAIITLSNFVFIAACTVWLAAANIFKLGKLKVYGRDFFIGHNVRWFTSLLLVFVFIFEVCDACLGEYYSIKFHMHNIVTPVISLLSVLVSLHYYHQVEARDLPASLSFLLLYWPGLSSLHLLKLVEYKYQDLSLLHFRCLLSSIIIFCYVALFLAELSVFIEKKYLCNLKSNGACKPRQSESDSDDNDVFKSKDEYVIYKHLGSSFLSKITYFWILPMLMLGYKKPLEMEDLGELPAAEKVENHYKKLQFIFDKSQNKANGHLSLWKCYIQFVGSIWVFGGFLKLCGDLVGFINPLAIKLVINYVQKSQIPALIPKLKMQYVPTIQENFENGFILSIVILLSAIVQSTLSQTSSFISIVEGIRLKVALQASVYKKALRIPAKLVNGADETKSNENLSAEKKVPNVDSAAVVNLISEDAQNVMSFFWQSHLMWAIPFKIIVLLVLLNLYLGYSSLVGALLSILTITPLQFFIGKKMSKNQNEIMILSDERMRKTNEFLQGMKVFKLNAWENFMKDKISSIRNNELKFLLKDSMYFAVCAFFTQASVILVALVTFGLYSVVEGKSLVIADVFTGLALFNQIMVPLFLLPVTVKDFINAKESTKRLSEFLSLSEVEGHKLKTGRLFRPLKSSSTNYYNPDNLKMRKHSKNGEPTSKPPAIVEECEDQSNNSFALDDLNSSYETLPLNLRSKSVKKFDFDTQSCCDEVAVRVKNGSFSWNGKNGEVTLKNINLSIPKGKLTVIVGPIGSGKTSLVSCLLGEMTNLSGEILWAENSTVAYVPQKPWLLDSTLRENILFGHGYAPRRYETVLRACALDEELEIVGCDDVEIGDKGINLSGGQKQRVCIARALYSTANVIIMDDSFSALDSEIGLHVFQEAIQKLLIQREKTVILVTHRFQFLNQAHQIVVVEKGTIKYRDHLKNIESVDPELYKYWNQAVFQEEEEHKQQIESLTSKERGKLAKVMTKNGLKLRSKRSIYRVHTVGYDGARNETDEGTTLKASMKRLLRAHSLNRSSKYIVNYNDESEEVPKNEPPKKRPASCSKTMFQKLRNSSNKEASISSYWEDETKQPKDASSLKQSVLHLKRLLSTSSKRMSSDGESLEKNPVRPPLLKKVSTLSGMSNSSVENVDEIELSEFGKLLEIEERKRGTLSRSLYFQFMKSCSYFWVFFYFLFAVGSQTVKVMTDFWLKSWASSSDNTTKGADQIEYESPGSDYVTNYLAFYVLLSLLSIITALLTNIFCQYAGARGRRSIHKSMMEALCGASMRFFDVTPVGSILNRCSSDMGVVDKKLTSEINKLVYFIFLCLSALVINAVVSPWFLLVVLPFFGIYFFVQNFFRNSARELQRMESITKSPVYSWFSETLEGIHTIRAYSQQTRFFKHMLEILDINNNIFLLLEAGNRWLGIVLDYLGSAITFIATLMAIAFAIYIPDRVDLGLVGLSMNYTFLVPMYLIWVVRCWSNTEIYMNAIERVQHYINICPEEEEWIQNQTVDGAVKHKTAIHQEWPTNGMIDFTNLSVCYDEILPPVLHRIKVHIKPLEKVAICGRSGSGKSTLIMSLFRIPFICEGAIYIDGIDITHVPLRQLRTKLSIVPQEPFLFSGTIRDNLDPGHECENEEEIWRCLELVKMKSLISSYPNGLNEEAHDCGSEFSTGQKQLLCLARAILRKSKIIVMDEPTSSVDPETESLMNNIINEAFKDRTVITVAHRISSIINYDKVIVMERGHIVEYGPPQVLKFRKNGVFAEMFAAAIKGGSSPR